jgi:short-subunit dehydrogenase
LARDRTNGRPIVPQPIAGGVSVVTGASSGIGLAVAAALAERGGRALAVPVDMAEEGSARLLAERAQDAFGRLDAWINNAAVSLFGRVEELPWAVYEQALRTNLFGYVHGARAAIPIFRAQGRGLLVNVASVAACVGQPCTSAYVVSKWGIRGLGECLRMELRGTPAVHACTVLPASVDTPIFQNAGNYTGRAGRPIPPVLPPEDVADAVLDLYARPRREVFVGKAGRAVAAAHALAPGLLERFMARQVERKHFQDRPAPPDAGNLIAPSHDAATGGWRQPADHRQVPWPTALAAGAVAALAFVVLARGASRGPGRRGGPSLAR